MKKFAALVLAVVLFSLVTLPAFAKTTYDPEKLQFVIVAADEETNETYVTMVGYKTVMKRIALGLVYQVFLIEADCLVELQFSLNADNEYILTNPLTMEEIKWEEKKDAKASFFFIALCIAYLFLVIVV